MLNRIYNTTLFVCEETKGHIWCYTSANMPQCVRYSRQAFQISLMLAEEGRQQEEATRSSNKQTVQKNKTKTSTFGTKCSDFEHFGLFDPKSGGVSTWISNTSPIELNTMWQKRTSCFAGLGIDFCLVVICAHAA